MASVLEHGPLDVLRVTYAIDFRLLRLAGWAHDMQRCSSETAAAAAAVAACTHSTICLPVASVVGAEVIIKYDLRSIM